MPEYRIPYRGEMPKDIGLHIGKVAPKSCDLVRAIHDYLGQGVPTQIAAGCGGQRAMAQVPNIVFFHTVRSLALGQVSRGFFFNAERDTYSIINDD